MTSLRVICGLGPPPIKNPGYAYDAKAINVRVASKNYSIRVLYGLFEVEYFRNCWVKKDEVNANLVLCDWPNFRDSHWFAFNPRLTQSLGLKKCFPTEQVGKFQYFAPT